MNEAMPLAGVAVLLMCGAAIAAAPYATTRPAGGVVLQSPEGKPIARYVVGQLPADEPQTTVPAVGYLHPIYTPSGQVLTESKKGGHGWLRGVFWAWPQVQGKTKAGFWTCGQAVWKEKGQIVNRSIETAADASSATVSAVNAWTDGQNDLLIEKTRIAARLVDGVNVVDVQITLAAADEPVKLMPWAFTGFTVYGRGGGSVAIHDPQGPVKRGGSPWNDPKGNWPDAAWYDLVLGDKPGKSAGLAVIGHPANPRTSWNMNPGLRFMSASVTTTEPTTVEKDKPLSLRYRLVAHDGPPPTDTLRALANEFTKSADAQR